MPPVRQSNTTVHCKGFTILELLVVIAVIAVLAALSATAGATALRRARNARCQGNLKQQGVAMASYVGTKGHYPGVTNPEQVDLRTNAWLWPHTLEREMTGSDDHIPPRFKGGLKGSVWDCPGSDGDPDLSIDYGYNAWGITSALEQQPLGLGGKIRERSLVGEPETPRVPVSEGDVFRPSQMIAL